MPFLHEIPRVQHHLDGALAMLHARDVSRLSPAVARVRAMLIAELRAYRDGGVFPHNHLRAERTPVFIDPHGTRCAMAHLLELCGFDSLVARVARGNNLARIRELAADPGLLLALSAMGLTVAEAARIQPEYCFYKKHSCLCGPEGQAAATSVVEAVVLEPAAAGRVRARVEKIYGTTTTMVGATIEVSSEDVAGTRLLVVEKSGGRHAITGGQVTCEGLSVPADVAANAMISAKCGEQLVARDARWGGSICDEESEATTAGADGGGFGCAVGSAASSAWLPLALAALWVATKRRTPRV